MRMGDVETSVNGPQEVILETGKGLGTDEFLGQPGRENPKPLMKNWAYGPTPGNAFNPLREYPRNARCFCGSGKKAKVCCLPQQAMCVSLEDAVKLSQFMAEKKAVGWETQK